LSLSEVFTFPAALARSLQAAEFRWTGLFIPYVVGTRTPNPVNAAESQAIAGYPLRFTLQGKLVVKTKKVRRRRVKTYWAQVSGQLRAGGEGVATAQVSITGGRKRVTARTNGSGSFSKLIRITRTSSFRATVSKPSGASSATCQPLIPISTAPLINPRCTGVTTAAITATSNTATVRKRR
jgi:hypothetical protein